MPIDLARLDLLAAAIDECLKLREQEAFADGAPQRIHGQPDEEQEIESPWGIKPPKPPVPIAHL
jgi:hypothetical protein